MTFKDWIFSNHPKNDAYNGQWHWQHILTLCVCLAAIALIAFFFRKKHKEARTKVIKLLVVCLLLFEVAYRVINFANGAAVSLRSTLALLLPRPWFAMSAWMLIVAAVLNKKTLYNFGAMNGLLCGIMFFAYPLSGFNHHHILFGNLYSIVVHSLLLVISASILTLRLGDFRYQRETLVAGAVKEAVLFVLLIVYAMLQVYVLKISDNPIYLLPASKIQLVLGWRYKLYFPLYGLFMLLWVNAFYLIPWAWNKYVRKGVPVQEPEKKKPQVKKQTTGRYQKTKGV